MTAELVKILEAAKYAYDGFMYYYEKSETTGSIIDRATWTRYAAEAHSKWSAYKHCYEILTGKTLFSDADVLDEIAMLQSQA